MRPADSDVSGGVQAPLLSSDAITEGSRLIDTMMPER